LQLRGAAEGGDGRLHLPGQQAQPSFEFQQFPVVRLQTARAPDPVEALGGVLQLEVGARHADHGVEALRVKVDRAQVGLVGIVVQTALSAKLAGLELGLQVAWTALGAHLGVAQALHRGRAEVHAAWWRGLVSLRLAAAPRP